MTTILNSALISKQELSDDDVVELNHLHEVREEMFEAMSELDPDNKRDLIQLRLFAVLLESLEFNMQRVWKFNQNRNRHGWWYKVPHCKCPEMDNADPLMNALGRRIISGQCPIHGKK